MLAAEAETAVAITGRGARCSLGADCHQLGAAVQSGTSGLRSVTADELADFRAYPMAQVAVGGAAGERCVQFARAAATEALSAAGVSPSAAGQRLALIVGSSLGGAHETVDAFARTLAQRLGIEGPRFSVSTACTSSSAAVVLGCQLLSMDAADWVLVGGADVLSPELVAGFAALGALSEAPCAPYSFPMGTSLGEGAGFFVLERRKFRQQLGVLGWGLAADAYHPTSPHPQGAGVERAVRAALGDDITSHHIGFISAHGTGTAANDCAEWLGLKTALGPQAQSLPVSSSKSFLGHAQGAAGALEAIVALDCLEKQVVPPTLHFTRPRPRVPPDPVSEGTPRRHEYRSLLSTNSAFGGSNSALWLGWPAREQPAVTCSSEPHRRRIGLTAAASWGAGGWNAHDFREDALPPVDVLPPRTDPRDLDPTAWMLVATVLRAFRSAGVELRGSMRDRCGLIVAQRRSSPTSSQTYARSFRERGPCGVSSTAFSRITDNAATGACARALSIRGPINTVSAGGLGALIAMLTAAEHLSTRRDADRMAVAAVEERAPDQPGPHGAAAVVLQANPSAGLGLDAWSLAAPGQPEEALDRAFERLGWARGRVPVASFDVATENALLDSVAWFERQCASIRSGQRRALVISDRHFGSVALLLSHLGAGDHR